MKKQNNNPRVIAVVGPTAVGKTGLAVSLAEALGGEVVCCDSMQIYRGMEIGAASPAVSERRGVPHHLFNTIDPARRFSCADYAALAVPLMKEIAARGKLPVLCGGTGLYLDRLIRGALPEEEADPAYRAELLTAAETSGGPDRLYAELTAADPEAAAKTHPNNIRRVIRALEMIRASGITKTERDRRANLAGSEFDITVIGLRPADREALYRRIDVRVGEMLSEGLAAEAHVLWERGCLRGETTAGQAIGYKELSAFFCGEISLEAAAENIKAATRRYAKRQLCWFSAKPYVHWIETGHDQESGEVFRAAMEIIKREFAKKDK